MYNNDSTVTIASDGYGLYHIGYHSSFTHSVNNTIVHMSAFINDVEDTRIEGQRKNNCRYFQNRLQHETEHRKFARLHKKVQDGA